MKQDENDIQKLSPQDLTRGFTKSRFIGWVGLALAIHVVVIGGLSVGFIRDNWIDPEGAKERKEAAEAVARAEAAKLAAASATNVVASAATNEVAPTATTTNATAADEIPEDRRNTPIVKAITEVPPTNEIPRVPDELGLGIQDIKIR